MRRILLVGFMASGKTTVGRSVARRLDWEFVDVDEVVAAREGRSVAEIFARDGEARFRRLEAEEAAAALARDRVVIAPGGGWAAAAPGRLDALPPGTLSVWLQVDPDVAVARARGSGPVRPLLAGPDPDVSASALSAERAPFYAPARLHLDTEVASLEALTETIARAVDVSRDDR